jgi:hypothetical protein
MLATIGRLVLVPIAFVIAAAVAAFVAVSLGLERATHAMTGRDGVAGYGDIIDFARQGLLLASGLSVVPALLLVIVGEVARIRQSMFYVVGGGLAVAATPILLAVSRSGALALPPAAVWQVLATAGFAGGFVYWLIAGRNA